MDLGISGKVALVTGAGRGIGAEICRTLAADGARIAVNDFFQERAEAAAAEIRSAGGDAIGVAADVTDLASIEATVSRVESELGPVDILV
ncbi:MAG: SDR family NAD(P)-dependent oxidoreductase, partial [Chloroflexi bacterium]|nr:SDR family NAD(P)-dependent oxidoreductase [Chloroflexota bacterium]